MRQLKIGSKSCFAVWGITFPAVVVFGLGKDLLFKSVLGHCDQLKVPPNCANGDDF